MTQLAFDLDELSAPPRPEYDGPAPLSFTTDYFTPDELLAAAAEVAARRGPWPWSLPSHTWHLGITTGYANTRTAGHTLVLLDTDLRCTCRLPYTVTEWESTGGCSCVGSLLSQANCPDCRWHALGGENVAVEAWHDHAWPGWRDLPILPLTPQTDRTDKGTSKRARAFFEAEYPTEFQQSGAPVITQRSRFGTRHVPNYSPWGGYDLCSIAVGGEVKVW